MALRGVAILLVIGACGTALWVFVQVRDRDERKRMRATRVDVFLSLAWMHGGASGGDFVRSFDYEADEAAMVAAMQGGSLARPAFFDDREYCLRYFSFLDERAGQGPEAEAIRCVLVPAREWVLARHPPRLRP